MTGWHVLIDRDDLRRTRVADAPAAPLGEGQARLRVDSFGLTANNITYGAAGDMLGYWTFFPAPDTDDDVNWGRVPVWGFADVVESTTDGVEVGERLYGYLPMSTELVIEPGRLSAGSISDTSAHRAALPPVYNELTRCASDPSFDPDHEDAAMIYRPLFFTSFMLDDLLDEHDLFGASAVVMTSASSKTAFGTAFLLADRDISAIGITSSGNVEFVEGLGCYDRIVAYDAIDSLPVEPAVLYDFSGNADVVRAVHEHYTDALRSSQIIGLTHWEDRLGSSADPLPGPAQEFFFAPANIDRRRAEWGAHVLAEKMGAAWSRFVPRTEEWVTVEHGSGSAAVEAAWVELAEGATRPDRAHVLHPGAD